MFFRQEQRVFKQDQAIATARGASAGVRRRSTSADYDYVELEVRKSNRIKAYKGRYTSAALKGLLFGTALDASDELSVAFVDYLKSGRSLWPVYSGKSRDGFYSRFTPDGFHIINRQKYAADVEERGTIGRIPGGKTKPRAALRSWNLWIESQQ